MRIILKKQLIGAVQASAVLLGLASPLAAAEQDVDAGDGAADTRTAGSRTELAISRAHLLAAGGSIAVKAPAEPGELHAFTTWQTFVEHALAPSDVLALTSSVLVEGTGDGTFDVAPSAALVLTPRDGAELSLAWSRTASIEAGVEALVLDALVAELALGLDDDGVFAFHARALEVHDHPSLTGPVVRAGHTSLTRGIELELVATPSDALMMTAAYTRHELRGDDAARVPQHGAIATATLSSEASAARVAAHWITTSGDGALFVDLHATHALGDGVTVFATIGNALGAEAVVFRGKEVAERTLLVGLELASLDVGPSDALGE
ncbi:hypothetical protein L6R52_11120 [Myxococcota bacterium]|nr:hypothetical protein [Myxococcota bacterium]